MNEFELINRYFNFKNQASSVLVGVGDDSALLKVESNKAIVVAMDSMVEDVHFSTITPIDAIAHKLVVSNVSDIVANGAIPKWATLSLTLADVDEHWLKIFSHALNVQLEQYGVSLVGGDTTKGKQIHLSMTIIGECQPSKYISRQGANAGDIICLSGKIGDSALGLMIEQGLQKDVHFIDKSQYQQEFKALLHRFYYPQIQIELGNFLQDYATAMIDVSDGLLQDLNHLIDASKNSNPLGIELNLNNDVTSKEFTRVINDLNSKNKANDSYNEELDMGLHMALSSGEEYVLCVTMSPESWKKIQGIKERINPEFNLYPIGKVTNTGLFEINGKQVNLMQHPKQGYKHF